jgi:PAS domain S-box-containing protein
MKEQDGAEGRILQKVSQLGRRIVELEETIAQLKSIDKSWQELRSIITGFAAGLQQGLAVVQDGNIIWANEAACKMFGYEIEELINTSGIVLAHPDYRQKLAARLKMIQAGDVLPTYDIWPFLTKTRVVKQIKSYANRIIYGGKPAILTILVDVSEEEILHDELSMRAEMLDMVADWIYLLDMQGNIKYANKAMLESLGYTLDEITGKNIVDISAKEFQEKTRIRLKTPSKKSEGRNRTVYLSKGHKRLTMFVRGKVIKRGDQEVIFAVAREIIREDEMGESLGDEYELWSK